MKKQHIAISLILIVFIALFVVNPKENIDAVFNGILVWATALLPALFPFFFFTRILNELGFVQQISHSLETLTNKLFHTGGISAYVYVLSILSGYPVGAKITSDLYENKQLTYGQACRTVTFTSTSGPLFIIGTVGIGMFASQKIGLIVLACHFVSALLNGILWRNYKTKEESNQPQKVATLTAPSKNLLESAMLNSIQSIFIIGGYVALFFMIISMMNNYHLLTFVQNFLSNALSFTGVENLGYSMMNGLVEITRGCLDLAKTTTNPALLTVLSTGIITFGGFSVHMQALTFLQRFKIPLGFYFLQKVTHTLLAVLLSLLCVYLF